MLVVARWLLLRYRAVLYLLELDRRYIGIVNLFNRPRSPMRQVELSARTPPAPAAAPGVADHMATWRRRALRAMALTESMFAADAMEAGGEMAFEEMKVPQLSSLFVHSSGGRVHRRCKTLFVGHQ